MILLPITAIAIDKYILYSLKYVWLHAITYSMTVGQITAIPTFLGVYHNIHSSYIAPDCKLSLRMHMYLSTTLT